MSFCVTRGSGQGFTCMLDVTEVLLREILLRRESVLPYPKGLA
jgi:hypothetical protein